LRHQPGDAAELAVNFVNRHQQAIRNIGLALHDAREAGPFGGRIVRQVRAMIYVSVNI
jgi:hypothetical protein